MNKYYSIVAGKETVPARLSRGQCGALSLAGTWDGYNWLSKKDLPGSPTDPKGRPMVYREWQILCQLQDTGLVPVVDEDTSPEDEEYFLIACINNAATVGDYCSAYLEGLIPLEVIREILSLVSRVVSEFHSLGWCHNDMHSNNIVIGHSRNDWEAFIIDVAVATKDNRVPGWLKREFIIADDPDEDIARLTGDMSALGEGCPDPTKVEQLNLLLGRLF
ncbi:hypothetical protein [Microcoleus phage My-WqHQDG]|nr:hypothetical protein [Microcoleus phage My-WqHQDG]